MTSEKRAGGELDGQEKGLVGTRQEARGFWKWWQVSNRLRVRGTADRSNIRRWCPQPWGHWLGEGGTPASQI